MTSNSYTKNIAILYEDYKLRYPESKLNFFVYTIIVKSIFYYLKVAVACQKSLFLDNIGVMNPSLYMTKAIDKQKSLEAKEKLIQEGKSPAVYRRTSDNRIVFFGDDYRVMTMAPAASIKINCPLDFEEDMLVLRKKTMDEMRALGLINSKKQAARVASRLTRKYKKRKENGRSYRSIHFVPDAVYKKRLLEKALEQDNKNIKEHDRV